MGVDQDHQIVSKTRLLDVSVLAAVRRLLRPLEHSIDLVEVDITEQWGDHPALRDATSSIGLQMIFSRPITSSSSTRFATLANSRSCRI